MVGHQHTGRLVAAVRNANGEGIVVIDDGRELAMIRADQKTAAALQHKLGIWLRVHADNDHHQDVQAPCLAWHIRELQREGRQREISFGS